MSELRTGWKERIGSIFPGTTKIQTQGSPYDYPNFLSAWFYAAVKSDRCNTVARGT